MVDSPRTQSSPGARAGSERPVAGSRILSSSPGSRNPTEPGFDGPRPWRRSQCEMVTQLYSVSPYAWCTSTPGNLASKAFWSSMPSGAAAVKTAFSFSLLRSRSRSVFTSCSRMGGTMGANVTPCLTAMARKSCKVYLQRRARPHAAQV